MPDSDGRPKVFISYSWTSQEHQDWVTSLAEQLENPGGIAVVYDLWDLRPGQDKYAYMERMVTDPSIDKVLIVADRRYKEKAEGREGGVGTESVIISQAVYEEVDQEKFIALPTEVDEEGRPFLPIFMGGRKYFDFSRTEAFYDRFEEIVRYLYDKPLRRRPVRSAPPSYVLIDAQAGSPTRPRKAAFENAWRRSSPSALGLLQDYLTSVAEAVGSASSEASGLESDFRDEVVRGYKTFVPTRDEFLDVVSFLAQYHPGPEAFDLIHRFFETLAPFGGVRDRSADIQRLILWDMFLHTTAALLRTQRLTDLAVLLGRPYYTHSREHGHGLLNSSGVFDPTIDSIDRNERGYVSNRESPRGNMLRDSPPHPSIPFAELVQADFLLGLRGTLEANKQQYHLTWYPRLMAYAQNVETFEIFSRAADREYFNRIKGILGIAEPSVLKDIGPAMHGIEGVYGERRFERLVNLENLASR